MLPILLSVFFISISGVLQPGIVTAMTIAKSYKSPWTGPFVALGHAVTEIPLILLVYFGFAHFFENAVVQIILSLAGGGMFIFLGIAIFRARTSITQEGKDLPYSAFTAGVLTSLLNPFFWLWWATVGSMLVMKLQDFGTTGLVLFIITHWSCDLIWLSTISFFIFYTQRLWGRRALTIQEGIFTICSLLLVGFGGWYLISGIQLIL
jgi:threonine/homoserine/homoserine lactone efflux protein